MTPEPKTAAQLENEALIYGYFESHSPEPESTAPRRERYLARLTPLHERLRTALAKFPRDLIADGLHMDQIWPLALGRQCQKARAWEVGAALRQLGWQRVRYYSDSSPSQTLWFPPDVSETDAKAAMKGKK